MQPVDFILIERLVVDRNSTLRISVIYTMAVTNTFNIHLVAFPTFKKVKISLHLTFLHALTIFHYSVEVVKVFIASIYKILNIKSLLPVTQTSVQSLISDLCVLICCHSFFLVNR